MGSSSSPKFVISRRTPIINSPLRCWSIEDRGLQSNLGNRSNSRLSPVSPDWGPSGELSDRRTTRTRPREKLTCDYKMVERNSAKPRNPTLSSIPSGRIRRLDRPSITFFYHALKLENAAMWGIACRIATSPEHPANQNPPFFRGPAKPHKTSPTLSSTILAGATAGLVWAGRCVSSAMASPPPPSLGHDRTSP